MADSAAELFLLEAWVADNPGSRLFIKLAQAYKDAGRLDESVQVLERGLVMHPAMVEARQDLAQVLEAMGDHEAALNQLMTAAAELCRHAGVFDGLARIWDAQGLEAEAKEARDLSQALTGALEGRVGSHTPAETPSDTPVVPGRAAKPFEPPEPAASGPGSAKMLRQLEAMERAARRRVRG